jgi:mitochondrial-processing peptidase subunit alpha
MPITEMMDKIDQVTPDHIRRVAARVFSPQSGSKPTVVCMGHEDVRDWGEVFSKYGLAAP